MGKRKDIQIISKVISGEIKELKKCTECNEVKELSEYHRSNQGLGGRASKCRNCKSNFAKKYNKTDETKNPVFTLGGSKVKKCKDCGELKSVTEYYPKGTGYVSKCRPCYQKERRKGTGPKPIHIVTVDGEESKECRKCGAIKPLGEFSENKNGRGVGGRRASCKGCMRLQWEQRREEFGKVYAEKSRMWRLANPKKQLLAQRRWRINNKHKDAVYQNTRKAKKQQLRNDLTPQQWQEILGHFGHACALTGNVEYVTMDHFIPISTGKGGTYVGNVYPLSSTLNNSKHNRNPFEWFTSYGANHGVSESAWSKLIAYLAGVNNMSEKEFIEYVNAQFKEVSDYE